MTSEPAAETPAAQPPQRVQIATETLLLPLGCALDDPNRDQWSIYVRWRGPRTETGMGGWAVTRYAADRQLSRAGKWGLYPPRFRLWQYRWETFEEAYSWALRVVDTQTVRGLTFAEFQQRHADAP